MIPVSEQTVNDQSCFLSACHWRYYSCLIFLSSSLFLDERVLVCLVVLSCKFYTFWSSLLPFSEPFPVLPCPFWGGEDHNRTQYSRWGQTSDLHSSITIFVLFSILCLIFPNIWIIFWLLLSTEADLLMKTALLLCWNQHYFICDTKVHFLCVSVHIYLRWVPSDTLLLTVSC